jgi:hypothetical protein
VPINSINRASSRLTAPQIRVNHRGFSVPVSFMEPVPIIFVPTRMDYPIRGTSVKVRWDRKASPSCNPLRATAIDVPIRIHAKILASAIRIRENSSPIPCNPNVA